MTNTNTQAETYTIGSISGSCIRTWQMLDIGREINNIVFYDDNGIITQSNYGWLEDNFTNSSCYDIQGVILSLKLNHHNNGYNLEKAMKNKCHFTVNNKKEYSFDNPSCTLYLYVNGIDFQFIDKADYQRLSLHSSDYSAYIQKYNFTTITPKHGVIQRGEVVNKDIKVDSYERKREKVDIKKPKTTELLDKTIEEFKKNGIYLKASEIGQILNHYTLTPKKTSTMDEVIPEIEAKYGKFEEIMKY